LGDEQSLVFDVETFARSVRLECRKIIFENERALILRVARSARPFIPRTQITGWIVLRLSRDRNLFDLPLPGTVGAMRRNQYPFAAERIKSAMRILIELQQFSRSVSTMNRQNSYCETELL
jgi:hypothetical protein